MSDAPLDAPTPCCGRRVRPLAVLRHATIVVHRTCPRCGTRWHIVAAPLAAPHGVRAHAVTWARVSD